MKLSTCRVQGFWGLGVRLKVCRATSRKPTMRPILAPELTSLRPGHALEEGHQLVLSLAAPLSWCCLLLALRKELVVVLLLRYARQL